MGAIDVSGEGCREERKRRGEKKGFDALSHKQEVLPGVMG